MARLRSFAVILFAALGTLAATWTGSTHAQYPDRTITVIVGASPGGPTDVIARITAEGLSKRLNQPVVVVNRPGANSAIAYTSFARSAPDGYTLFMMTALTSSLPLLQQGFTEEPVASVEPIALLAMNSIAVLARGNAPFATLPELLAFGRANPGKLNYATVGGLPELLGRYIFQKEKVTATHIAYKGAADITNDLLGQRVDVALYSLVGIGGHIADGRVKLLATTGKARSAARPNVPTIAETIPGLELEDINYFGIVAPKGTPADVIARLHRALVEVGQAEEFQSKIRSLESLPVVSTPAELQALMSTIANWKVMAKEVGFTPR